MYIKYLDSFKVNNVYMGNNAKAVNGNMDKSVKNPLILSIETSSRIGSVALASGEDLLEEKTFSDQMMHSAELFPAVKFILNKFGYQSLDINHVYVSAGPGSFTGLRIGITIAKMLALAGNAEIVAVDSLDVIAENMTDIYLQKKFGNYCNDTNLHINKIAVILDAKRGSYYVAVYKKIERAGRVEYCKIVQDSFLPLNKIINRFVKEQEPVWLLGDGLVYNQAQFRADGIYFVDSGYWSPHSRNVHRLGWQKALRREFVSPADLLPMYLCRPQVTIKL